LCEEPHLLSDLAAMVLKKYAAARAQDSAQTSLEAVVQKDPAQQLAQRNTN